MSQTSSPYFAAVDLGSNSFHMIIARRQNNTIETIDRVKEMVQIARGLESNKGLSEEAQQRALDCLQRFAERLRDIPTDHIRAVGTRTLRSANNANAFLSKAETALNHPIEIISGYEEARLVYSGLAHSVTNDGSVRFVADIGGGSTECIIGQDGAPELLESLGIGCVTYTEKYGLNEKITEKTMRNAYQAALREMETIRKPYLNHGWDVSYGTSGTIRAIADLLSPTGSGAIITRDDLETLRKNLIQDAAPLLQSLPKLRRDVLPAGVAILTAIFDVFKMDKCHAADATLKDGLVYELIGRFHNVDERYASVSKLQKRYHVDINQANRVASMALDFWQQISEGAIPGVSRTKILKWAAELHEVGLGISHSSYHNHGFYILRHSDLAGFGRYEQYILASLVQSHRKKIRETLFLDLDTQAAKAMMPLVICLRLAAVLCRRREDLEQAPLMKGKDGIYYLAFTEKWLDDNPLTKANLEAEIQALAKANIELELIEQ